MKEKNEGAGYEKLSFLTKFSYGCGDFASQLTLTLVNSYLLIFYTDVVGLMPVAISVIMLITRIWDAINDPMLGAIAERTHTRWGRFRPYLLFGAPVLAIATGFTFMSPNFSVMGKNIYALITYTIWGMLFTAVNIPYGSLSSVMTKSPVERNKLNSFRMIGTNLAGMLLSGAVIPVVTFFGQGNDLKGYTCAAFAFGIASVPLFFLLFFNSKEVIEPVQHEKMPVKTSFMCMIKNRNMLVIIAFLLFYMIGLFGRMAIAVYYIMYSVARVDLIPVLMMLPSCGAVIGILISSQLLAKVGRKRMIIIAALGSGISLIILYFIPLANIELICLFSFIYGLFQFAAPIGFTLTADTIDYGEDRFGYRIDGFAFGITSFSTKLANTIAGVVGVPALVMVGYVANAEQTMATRMGINGVVNLGCGLFLILAAFIMFFYNLSDEECAKIRQRLDQKQALRNKAEN